MHSNDGKPLSGYGTLKTPAGGRKCAPVWTIPSRLCTNLGQQVTRSYSPEYRANLRSEHWRDVRAEALRRAGHKCQQCGKTAKQARCSLDAHHALGYGKRDDGSEILGNEDPSELLILCRFPCHRRAHGRPGYGRLAWRWWRYRLGPLVWAVLGLGLAIEIVNVLAFLTR